MKILIIEDEQELLSAARFYLSSEGYICEGAATFADALDKVTRFDYDCIIADINLPDGSGMDLINELKGRLAETGVIIISARSSLEDKIIGLDIGADDYMTKPFHLSELNARVKSILRRRKFQGSKEIGFHEINLVPEMQRATIHGETLTLTKKEFDLLLYFIANRNKVLTKESIVEHLWSDYGNTPDTYDFVYTHVSNLRRKLIEKGSKDYVKSVYGVGYKFTDA
jgi:DNA-binding response OmpR family regulator